ncbi:MAG: acyltransferase [Clostridia bacterium]|nr:acyltransferase [Clostridia bacterium]
MIVYFVILAAICLWGIRFRWKEGFENYMSPQTTGAIKGIFVVIVLFSHLRQYIHLSHAWYDQPYQEILHFLGQLMVVAFFFYSGYGVFVSIRKKPGYVKTLPVRRVLRVWLHFALAVCLYFVMQLALGKRYTVKDLLLSTIGVKGLGNSAWFVIVILLLYVVTYLAFTVFRKHLIAGAAAATVLSAALFFAVRAWKGPEYWWYDTIPCYPLGMWYAVAEPQINKLLPSPVKWCAFTGVTLAGFLLLHAQIAPHPQTRRWFMAAALLFALLLPLLSMRVQINNAALRWCGKRVFGIYILQRIPMILLAKFFPGLPNAAFAAITIVATCLLAEGFERAMDALDRLLHLSRPKPRAKGASAGATAVEISSK